MQTTLVVVVAAASIGGMADWAPRAIGAAVALVIIPLMLYFHSRHPPRWRAFFPAMFFIGYIGIALLNPSHMAVDGGWLPRAGWIPWLPTTVDRTITLSGAWPWICALVQGGALAGGLRSRRAVRALGLALSAATAVFALVGAVAWFAGATKLLGLLPVSGRFFSTFVYRNHWSAFAILGASCAAGVAFSAWDRVSEDWTERHRHARSVRLFGFSVMILILLTPGLPGSRSGTVMAALLALIVVGVAFARLLGKSNEPWRRLLFGAAVFAVAAVTTWAVLLSQDSLRESWRRSEQEWRMLDEKGDLRIYVARDTWRMVKARPWFGWGAGCFEPVFPLYQGDYLRDDEGRLLMRWEHAHCDWMEILAEFGLVGFGLLLVTVGLCVKRLVRAGGSWSRWVLLGLAFVTIYALAEFPFHNPAVLIFWTVLLAACAARIPIEQRFGFARPVDRHSRCPRAG